MENTSEQTGQIIGLKFREQGQIYYFLASPFVVKEGDRVLVKTEEGLGLGTVVILRSEVPEGIDEDQLKSIYRIATQEDLESDRENKELARQAFEFCKKCISQRDLDMKLVDVEVYFDRSKMIFYFTAPGRIDFRELVKDLVRAYRTRIELRQIGVRHETQMLGGLGNCGQVCCCRRYLRKFEPVTIKMAKEQNLFLNPAKISGVCGRLLCCLNYEEQNYTEFRKRCPKVGKNFSTQLGRAKVLRANMFRDTLVMQLETGEEREISLDEWQAIRSHAPEGEHHQGPRETPPEKKGPQRQSQEPPSSKGAPEEKKKGAPPGKRRPRRRSKRKKRPHTKKNK